MISGVRFNSNWTSTSTGCSFILLIIKNNTSNNKQWYQDVPKATIFQNRQENFNFSYLRVFLLCYHSICVNFHVLRTFHRGNQHWNDVKKCVILLFNPLSVLTLIKRLNVENLPFFLWNWKIIGNWGGR